MKKIQKPVKLLPAPKRSVKDLLGDDDDLPPMKNVTPKSHPVPASAKKPDLKAMLGDDEPEPVRARVLPLSEPCPPGFFSLSTDGEKRAIIMTGLDKNWEELLCFAPHLGCTVHLKRADLFPKDRVADAIAFLQKIRNS